jgi:hypothetical protein
MSADLAFGQLAIAGSTKRILASPNLLMSLATL